MQVKKKLLIYGVFFVVLFGGFLIGISKFTDFFQSDLQVINDHIQPFSFVDQNGSSFTKKNLAGKVYVTEYFFTTCRAICPRINANMRRVYDAFKEDSNFAIVSHTCMPETDSVPVLKRYEYKMLTGKLEKGEDGVYEVNGPYKDSVNCPVLPKNFKTNWFFVTGDKATLYSMAKHSYLIDDNKIDTTQKIGEQFLHTQLFALVDKQMRVRAIYDALNEEEMQKLFHDIKDLLREKSAQASAVNNGWSNTPN
jgi:protein SCO1/2